jgi:hypothetical protein
MSTGAMAEAPAGRALRRRLLPLLLAGVSAAVASPAAANRQIDEGAGTLEQVEKDAQRARSYGELVQVRLYSGSDIVIGSDFGEFDATSYDPGGRVKVTLPVAENAAIRVVARGSALLTEFDDVSTNLFGTPTTSDPFGNLYSTSFELQGGMRPGWSGLLSEDERWTFLAETRARANWEGGARFGSSVTMGGGLGVGYQIGNWLEILVGVGASSGLLDGGISFSPVFEIDWRFAERWRVRSRGMGGQLEYDVDDDLTIFTGAQRQSRSYLTADRVSLGGDGRLRDRSLPVTIGVRWDISPHVELTLVSGALLRHELRTENHEREDVGHVRAGPTPFVGVTFELRPDARRPQAAARAAQGAAGAGVSSTSISTSR